MKYLLIIGLLCLTQFGYGCTCFGESSISESIKGARTIFSGTVVSLDTLEFEKYGITYYKQRVIVSPTSIFKGKKVKNFIVMTGMGNGDCGFHFELGQSYLVYGIFTKERVVETDICFRTRLESEAEEDFEILRKNYRAKGSNRKTQFENGSHHIDSRWYAFL